MSHVNFFLSELTKYFRINKSVRIFKIKKILATSGTLLLLNFRRIGKFCNRYALNALKNQTTIICFDIKFWNDYYHQKTAIKILKRNDEQR